MDILIPDSEDYNRLKGIRENEITSGRCGFCSGRCGKCLDSSQDE